ncbi:MAG TPA: class I SAM-dependent methyltransferase [archaeon]|nr:class I SAM-dependent methyltransferase [archaeon]
MDFKEPGLADLIIHAYLLDLLTRPFYKRYVNSLVLEGNEKVLDFGCGCGSASRYLAQCLLKGGGRLVCVDISEALIKIAKKRLRKHPHVELKVGEISTLNFENDSFDAVFIHFMLHDIEKQSRQEIVNTLSRILKDTGKLLIREPAKESHGMPVEEIREVMRASGLKEIDFKVTRSLMTGQMYAGVFKKQ